MTQSLRAQLADWADIQWRESTESTNSDLLAQARAGQPLPRLLGTHLQTRGRGRANRDFRTAAGHALMFSCAFESRLPVAALPTLSVVFGLAACESLAQRLPAGHQLRLKWPNDLQWQSAKLAGILVEVTRSGTARLSSDHYVAIMGIGLNLNDARALSTSLNRQVADWSEIASQDTPAASVSAVGLVASIAQAWYDCLNEVTAHGLDFLPQRYAQVDALAGQHVNILDDGRILQAGIACGVNTQGQLLLRNPQGDAAVSIGEVSVRPLKETP